MSADIQCPICFRATTAANDAFLQPCYHAFCFQCIKSWIENKRASGVPVSCPVCRQASSALLYNCAGEPHDHWNLTAPGPAPTSTPRDSGLPQPGDAAPSEIADRRRAYTLPAACVIAACEHAALTGRQLSAAPRAESGRASTAQGAQQGGASSCEQAPHIVVRQDIHGAECRAWLRRELRALLHCPEPDIAEAIVRRGLPRAQQGTGRGRPEGNSVPGLRSRIEAATSQLLRADAATFTECLVSFLQSRGSVEAWDRRFADGVAAARPPCVSASSGAGAAAPGRAPERTNGADVRPVGACERSGQIRAHEQGGRFEGLSSSPKQLEATDSTRRQHWVGLLSPGVAVQQESGHTARPCRGSDVLSTSNEGRSDSETDDNGSSQ